MGKPYSVDLRERIVGAIEEGGLSPRRTAGHYGAGISTVICSVRRIRETGSVAPGKTGGYKPKKIRGVHRAWLVERVRQGDFTLRGLVAKLTGRGLRVDYQTV